MVFPGMGMGVKPEQIAKVQAVSKFIKGSIRVDYRENTIQLTLSSDMENAKKLIPGMMNQFAENLAVQLSSFFAIQGEIVEVGKGEEVPEKTD